MVFLDKQDLFEARTGGYATYRIPSIVISSKNTVIVTTEARTGKGGDYNYNDILMRRSLDGGRTFQAPVLCVDHRDYGNGPINNFVMIPDQLTGKLHALFCFDYARVFKMHSTDDGANFSRPVDITAVLDSFRTVYPWQVCAMGPGHGLQLQNGRMIIPVWLSDGSGQEFGKGHRGHRPSVVSLIYSDDHGQSWHRGEIICKHGDRIDSTTLINPSETVAVELTDGSVMFNIRSESKVNRRLVATNRNGVSGWHLRGFDETLLEKQLPFLTL